ncbi:MAG: hypothetical protein KGS72_26950 [Cyanobacteria bacterium REEB67]|nr:hypothetical protein [Cyanobacteria bacterium REEB67]
MQQPAQAVVKTSDLSLNGLDEVFDVDTTLSDDLDQASTRVPEADITVEDKSISGLTIKEASAHYALAVATVRLKIKLGEIPAIKVSGAKGPEWRVYPDGIPQGLDQPDITDGASVCQPDDRVAEDYQISDSRLAQGFHLANINVASLIEANQQLTSKLESVVYRNGYLQAQLEAERQQIKLLTDQLHKPTPAVKENWWARLGAWFIGRG